MSQPGIATVLQQFAEVMTELDGGFGTLATVIPGPPQDQPALQALEAILTSAERIAQNARRVMPPP